MDRLENIINETLHRYLLNEITIRDKFEKEKERTKWTNPRDFQHICQSDPTYNREKDIVGKYTNWLLIRLNDLSDLERVRVPLEWYADGMKRGILQRQGISPDINTYKSVDEFISAMQSVMKSSDEPMQSASEMNNREKLAGQFKVIGQSRYWEVISPLTFEAERWFGRKTEWCTVANEDYFEQYGDSNGELFIFYPKNGELETRIQVHFDSESYFDVYDNGYDDITQALASHNGDEDIVADGVNLANELWNLNLKYIKFSEVPELLAQGVDPKEIFDKVLSYDDDFAVVVLHEKWNYINKNSQLLSSQWFDDINGFSNGFGEVCLGNKWNFINTEGKILYKPNNPNEWFDWTTNFSTGFARIEVNGKYNYINIGGKILYKPNNANEWFDSASKFEGGFAIVRINGKYNFINTEGQILYKPNEPNEWFEQLNDFNHKDYTLAKLKGRRYILRSDGILCDYHLQPIPELNESKSTKRIFYINESTINDLFNAKDMTEYKFISNVKKFLSQLIDDPVNAQPSRVLKFNGLDRKKLISKLMDNGIIIKKERISDRDENGNPKTATMLVSFKIPREDFDHKMKKLYISLFENVQSPYEFICEDGGAGASGGACAGGDCGGMSCGEACSVGGATSADASGQFITPLFGTIVRRKKKKSKKNAE